MQTDRPTSLTFSILLLLCVFSIESTAMTCGDFEPKASAPLDYEKIIPASREVSLTANERELLEDYRSTLSYDITGYQRHGTDYLMRRKELMNHSSDVIEEAQSLDQQIKKVFDLLSRFPKYSGYVFRAIDIGRGQDANFSYWLSPASKAEFTNYLYSLKIGDTLTNKEYWSSSKSFEVAFNISSEPKIVFIIKSRSGKDLSNHAGTEWRSIDADNEEMIPSHEVIFIPGSRFKVTKIFIGSEHNVDRFIVLEEQ